MINILVCSFLSTIYHFISGLIFSRYFGLKKNNIYYFALISLCGIVFLSFISLILNFFVPLNKITNSLIFIVLFLSVLILYQDTLKNYYKKTFFSYIIFCSFGTFILILLSGTYNPDSALYHFPYTNIINENKIIVGISNIHQRFGHISIIQYLNAHHFNFFFGLNGITIPIASIAVYCIFFFLINIYKLNIFSFAKIFAILITFYFCWKMNRYSEYGNDAPAHFLFFVSLLIYLNYLENKNFNTNECFYLVALFTIFAFTNKTFLIISLLLPLILFFKFSFKKIFNFKLIILLFFLFSWILKNILTTGCLIYPAPITCLDTDWSNFSHNLNIFDVAKGSEAWAKDWPNRNGDVQSYDDYISNLSWIKVWSQNHLLKITEIVIPYIFLIFLFILILKMKIKKNVTKFSKKAIIKYFPLFLVIIVGILVWFFKGPIYRYGYSYIISFIALLFTLIIFSKYRNLSKNSNKNISNIIIILSLIVLVSKQMVRVVDKINHEYNNYPWPKYFSYTKNNNKVKMKKIFKQGDFYYYAPVNNYCYYSQAPCTSEKVDKKIKKKINYLNYTLFYFEK